jgi:hypothetical protein
MASTNSSHDLVAAALRSLDVAITATRPAERFAAAHLAALRAAAALVAAHAKPSGRRPTSVWLLLPRVAPDCADWAAYFAAGATKRALAEAGVSTVVSEREADDLVRGAHDFINLVADRLGVTRQMTLTAS